MSDNTVLQITRWVILSLLLLVVILFIMSPLAGVLACIAFAVGYNVLTFFHPRVSQVLRDNRQQMWLRLKNIFPGKKEIKVTDPSRFNPDHYFVCSSSSPPICHLVSKESVVIGRDPACEIILSDNPSVGLKHCRIRYRSHSRQYFIEDLRSKSGTYLGTKRLEPNSPQQLFDDQEIFISSQRFIFTRHLPPGSEPGVGRGTYPVVDSISGETVAETMGVRITFQISFAGRVRTETLIVGSRFIIGRAPGCSLVLSGDDLVSKEHALLFAENNIVKVVDMGSTNGTFISGVRVPRGDAGSKNAMTLASIDVLKVGGHTLSVTY